MKNSTKNQDFKIFHAWMKETFGNPNALAYKMGINSGRLYNAISAKRIPSTVRHQVVKLGCPISAIEPKLTPEGKIFDGQLLKSYLLNAEMDNKECAEKLGVKPQYICNLLQKSTFSAKLKKRFAAAGIEIHQKPAKNTEVSTTPSSEILQTAWDTIEGWYRIANRNVPDAKAWDIYSQHAPEMIKLREAIGKPVENPIYDQSDAD